VSPILLWVAFRIDLLGSAIAALLISIVAVAMTVYGHGPIPALTAGNISERVQFLQLFLAVVVLMPMVTAVLFCAMRDTRRALHSEMTRAEITLHSIGDGVITTDARGVIDFINPIAERLTGWPLVEARGQPIEKVFHVISALDRTRVVNPVARCLEQRGLVGPDIHSVLVGRSGDEYSIQDSVAAIWSLEHVLEGVVLVFSDDSERQRLALTAVHDAAHDPLTGVVNRREFERRLQQALDAAHKEDITHALVYLDLDQFKVINDTKGHGAGDEHLRQLSHRLNALSRTRDTFARLGGDEFGLLMERCTLEQARRTTESLLDSVREFRFVWEGQPFRIGASMGLVAVDGSSRTITELLRRADAACYGAKEHGRDQIHLYTEDDFQLAERRGEMHWVSRIQKALEEDQFRLYYQPIVALSQPQGDGIRCELLLRLESEAGEIIPPGAFSPAAERYDLAAAIDQWVVKNALRWIAAHPGVSARLTHVAINLSGHSMVDPHMAEYIERQFQQSLVAPEKICFEVTETAAIANLDTAASFFDRMKKLGCEFAFHPSNT
jgi:diguanylate cyclase (GGDEF)-like protein/PAS domain S-box-containing protein